MQIETWSLTDLNPAPYNPRKDLQPGDPEYERLKKSIQQFDYVDPLIVNRRTGRIVGGHQRYKILRDLGYTDATVSVVDLDETQEKALNVALNKTGGTWDDGALATLLQELTASLDDIEVTGFGADEVETLLSSVAIPDSSGSSGHLASDWGAPPFSVFDARTASWQERKRQWLALGIQSELGRENTLLGFSDLAAKFGNRGGVAAVNTSVFDPVLTELLVQWFCPPGGRILDPFAGGSVRGIVSAYLGFDYTGIDLRAEQVAANEVQWATIGRTSTTGHARWIVGDSGDLDQLLDEESAYDLILTCPPYADLEVYSDDPRDLSTMDYPQFLVAYRKIIERAVHHLRANRFAAIVVGEVRDPNGAYRHFVGDTARAFRDAGMMFWNEAVLVTPAGSLPLRVRRQWGATRKLGKTHQNVLIFYQGDPQAIRRDFPESCPAVSLAEEPRD
jgi:hypothetical protein